MKQTSDLEAEFEEFRRGDFVKVLHTRRESNGEISDWMRPALYLGNNLEANYVLYTDGTKEVLNNSSKLKWIGR